MISRLIRNSETNVTLLLINFLYADVFSLGNVATNPCSDSLCLVETSTIYDDAGAGSCLSELVGVFLVLAAIIVSSCEAGIF